MPPFVDFPSDLADKIKHSLHLLDGGFRFDGKEIVPVNDEQVISCITRLQQGDYPCKNVVVAGLFSPLSGEQEEHVGKLIADHFPDVSVTKSYEVSFAGLTYMHMICLVVGLYISLTLNCLSYCCNLRKWMSVCLSVNFIY